MTDRLTVVGGGIGGLTAAIAAAESGWAVHLLEAKATLGGRAWTTDGPYRANWGPHVVYADGPLWTWLDERRLTEGVAHVPRVPRLRVRVDGRGRRPPASLFLAARRLTHSDAPVERTFRAWAVEQVGERDARRLAAFLGVATFDHGPGRLSAAFANPILRRATAFPPTVRYFPGGWATLVDRLEAHARELGVEIETGARVDRLPAAPVVLAVPPPVAAALLDDPTVADVTGTTTALLDVGLRRWRTDPYVLSDLDAPGFCETFTVVDPSLAPSGQHLVQTQTGVRPGEELGDAVARLEALLDAGYDHWRARETWRRRARVHHETGALDLPGTTWRDRPAVDRGDGVRLVNDFAAAPGLLSEVSHRAALVAIDGLGTSGRAAGRARPIRMTRVVTWEAPARAPAGSTDLGPLVRRARRGDPLAQEALVREVMPAIAPVCGAIALDAGDDAMQETLIVVLRRIGTLREPAALRSWARRIAAREAVRVARQRAPVVPDDVLAAATPPVELPDLDTVIDVRAALDGLAPEQRAVLVLRDLDGLGEADVARILAVPTGTVKSRLHRSRAAFARRWSP